MKKSLLLSVVASTMIMAGGDIAPVEATVAPAPVAKAAWDFSGQAVVYYQTSDNSGASNLFSQKTSLADAGLKLKATNKDLIAGIGAGVELNGLTTLGLEHKVVSNVMQGFGGKLKGGWISQAYLTYGTGNTSVKLGRQELPKSLSPFAFSEGWNVFKNTFDAALVVNSDIQNTTLVGAWVHSANINGVGVNTDLSNFTHLNNNDGVYMLTVQNKSVDNLTLTGSFYYGKGLLGGVANDTTILWGDAKYNAGSLNIALQGGTIKDSDLAKDTTAFGAKVGGTFNGISTSVAYSTVDDGNAGVFNTGGVKTPLYTQMILNQGAIKSDNDTVVVRASSKVAGGTLAVAYDMTTDNSPAATDYTELDVVYKTKVADSTTLLTAYLITDHDVPNTSANNVVRVWARYNF